MPYHPARAGPQDRLSLHLPLPKDAVGWRHDEPWSIVSISVLSLWSEGSVLSIGSVGSVASLGSVGSFASMVSLGSSMSRFSALSFQSDGSILSHQSEQSVLSSQTHQASLGTREHSDLPSAAAPALALAGLVVAGATYARVRATP